MTDTDVIWVRARGDLTIVSPHGEHDVYLIEHSERVARSALAIANLPTVQAMHPDMAAVEAAALYHDAGWAARVALREANRLEIATRSNDEAIRELSVAMMERSLADLLHEECLDRARIAILTLQDRQTTSIEAKIVSEAETLDEIGPLSLWPLIRRQASEGRGVQAALDVWRRQVEYGYWAALINDTLRFEPVRALARRRLAQFDRLMQEIDSLNKCADLPPTSNPITERSRNRNLSD